MRGFTLVEVMIAALLMSIMALMSWRVLESMTRTQSTLHVRGLAVEDTQALFNQWQRDCHALLPPDQWVLGVPVHLGTRQMAWMVHEAGAVRVVSYALVGGVVRRAVSSALTTRGELNGVWQAVLQGELPRNSGGQASAGAVTGGVDLQDQAWLGEQGWVDATQDPALSVQSVRVRGLALEIFLGGTAAPLRQVCLTGQD
ncbi:prepilin-type N-terminal cleavage/methylation domain-containing protein [Ferrovum sp.]|uniref:PulJ/GspJ family protein n=1 Tax=Ferrovum sp. TaxID=2609467 RepID=UPI002616361B|nr:prepilin-type N-terminal cleavage/methylation domain-containing protein [Ferrovum sp.]